MLQITSCKISEAMDLLQANRRLNVLNELINTISASTAEIEEFKNLYNMVYGKLNPCPQFQKTYDWLEEEVLV